MAREPSGTPKFTKNQVVKISLYDQEGRFKNDLAKRCIAYAAKPGVVGSWGFYFLNGATALVYHVRMDDGKVLLLTEDCLMPVKGPV
jgi:hypothetical protein